VLRLLFGYHQLRHLLANRSERNLKEKPIAERGNGARKISKSAGILKENRQNLQKIMGERVSEACGVKPVGVRLSSRARKWFTPPKLRVLAERRRVGVRPCLPAGRSPLGALFFGYSFTFFSLTQKPLWALPAVALAKADSFLKKNFSFPPKVFQVEALLEICFRAQSNFGKCFYLCHFKYCKELYLCWVVRQFCASF